MTSRDDDTTEQEDVERESRQTGGDAPAAGSIEEREAVAEDTDDAFEGPRDTSEDGETSEDDN